MIGVRLLGAVAATVDGRPADLGGLQRRAVVARLAVAGGEVVPTDRLVDDLWAGEPPPRALAGLQAHVSHLRRVLEPGRAPRTPATVLVSAAGGYALRVGDGLDVTRAEELRRRARTEAPTIAAGTLREALALWSGAPLAEFADAAWAGPEIERLAELRRSLVEALAAVEPDARAVVDLLGPLVREEPLREEPVRLLALALYRSGRQAEALAAIAALRGRLADDLGLDPSPALAELEGRILRHDVSDGTPLTSGVSDVPSLTRPEPRPDDAPALVGRDRERDRLLTVADAVAAGPGRLALVVGEAGAGKSALADVLVADLARRGWRTVRGHCPEVDGAPPAWAWTEIAEGLHDGGASLTSGVSDVPSLTRGIEGTFHAGRALLAAVRDARRPLLVVLDDLHRGDEETWRLLRIVASAAVPAVLVVGTFRPGEVTDELVATVAALAAVTAERVELGGLAPDAVAALVAAEDVAIDDDAARGIAERTGGNPLFVREVARLARTVGLEEARRTVPAGVRDVLSHRAAQLPAASLSVLRRAAALGRDVDVSVLVALEDDEDRVLAACEAGVVTGLLVESGPDAVRFTHDLVRETLYDELPRLRRARLHAEVLRVLEALRPHDHAALARHALAAGPVAGLDRVLDHAERAAHEARRDGVPRTAADLLAAAVGLATDPARRVRLRCALASAYSHAGAGAPAVAERSTALVELARLPDDRELALRAATCVDGPVTFALAENGEVDRALVDLVGRLLATDLPAPDRVRLLVARAFAWHPREPELAMADADAAADLLPDDDDLRCLVLNARFWSLLRPDRWDGLDDLGTAMLAAADRARSLGHRSVGHHARFLHACHREDFAAARAHAATALAEAPDGQLAAVLSWTTIFRGMEATIEGRYDEAEALYVGFGEAMAARGLANASVLTFVGLVAVRHARGRLGDLVGMLAAEHAARGEVVAEPYAAALVAAGRLDEARRVWRPDIPVSRDWWWVLWTVLRAETALALGERAVAAGCRRDLEPWAGHLAGAMSGTATLGRVDEVLAALAREQ
ncbi:BTAD domain-containing putative transcriptional regulator [Actinomycetospora atypica]|uniref:BTAD domain-containing putative transcriptional regulator n=1 Tax=Actinomycetospora atypica TaxID=1290095 RepID=A0ABV9YTY8_9PSEU